MSTHSKHVMFLRQCKVNVFYPELYCNKESLKNQTEIHQIDTRYTFDRHQIDNRQTLDRQQIDSRQTLDRYLIDRYTDRQINRPDNKTQKQYLTFILVRQTNEENATPSKYQQVIARRGQGYYSNGQTQTRRDNNNNYNVLI